MKQAEVIWALAHIGPATVAQIEGFMEGRANAVSASTTVNNVWRDGLIVRRRVEDSGQGGVPYEYALAPAESE